MRRTLSPSLALLTGLVTLLAGCAGESPTSPSNGGGNGGNGSCNVVVQLTVSSLTSVQGTPVVIRATATRGGAAVPDGQSIFFFTDFGFFAENGLPNASKLIVGGVADITLVSDFSGIARIKATLDCGSASTQVSFSSLPSQGPFISSISPSSGSCAGGEIVTLTGGRFGTNLSTTRVTFGGAPATVVAVSDSSITVKTPQRTLANPQVPEKVDIVATINAGTASTQSASWTVAGNGGFTYFCVDKRIFISAVSPNNGPQDGGTSVTISGGNFGNDVATTRVTFGGVAASIQSVSDNAITVTTPRHVLANANVPETVDVAVTKDLGLVSQQSAVLTQAFTYRANSLPPGQCPPSQLVFISSITPNTGTPDGGDVVTINGGGFGTSLATVRVDFGNDQARVTAVSPNSVTVSTPRHPLVNPLVPETVDVAVTSDVGGPNCATARLANGFTYTLQGLQPKIYHVSPTTGPNDVSTRVTIFGQNFQFPMTVLLSTNACEGSREAAVVSIKFDTVVFLTPIAANGNSCLANQLVTVTVLNPTTGKTDKLTDAFKYYSCPTVSNASPQFGPWSQTTTVTINGQNFTEPVDAQFVPSGGGAGPIRLNVSSVAVSQILVQLPPIDPQQVATGGATCANLSGTITVAFPATSCAPLSVPFTYKIDPPQITNASPTQLAQDGCPFGAFGCSIPQTITVSGAFFEDPMTVVLTKDGAPIAYTTVNNPSVSNPATLTFLAPAIKDPEMNVQACSIGAGVTGTKFVPTSFGIQVTNRRTGCVATLSNILIYNPADPTCRSTPIVAGPATLPAATLCAVYPGATAIGSGGTPPYTWSATGLPPGMSINALTGAISGTPTLSAPGASAATTVIGVTITVTDAIAQAGTRSYALVLNDPAGPFTVTGATAQTIAGTGSGSAITASSAVFAPVNWTIAGAPAGMTVTPTGTSTTINNVAVPTGSYPVTVTATDSACGGVPHTNALAVTVTVP